jgi:3-oxoacyl-[acyl-carrier-protein] synthase I
MAILTDIGIVNCLGSGVKEVKNSLQADPHSEEFLKLTSDNSLLLDRSCLVGRVTTSLPEIPKIINGSGEHPYNGSYFSLALSACVQLTEGVEKIKEKIPLARIGVVVGSSTSGIQSGEEAYLEYKKTASFPSKFHYAQQEMGSLALFIADYFQLKGPAYTISTACTSGAKAIAAARRLLNCNVCDVVITGGVDSLCKLTTRGFNSLNLLSSGKANPFSTNRDGLNLGEGACLFIMQRTGKGVEVKGVGESSDAHHMSAPHPKGEGAIQAIIACLKDAEVEPQKVGYVNLHGTGTEANDSAEALAVSKTLGFSVPVSSTKPFTGHLLGAAGSSEAGLCYILLQGASDTVSLPPHLWDECREEQMPALNFIKFKERVTMPVNAPVISTSFAFGGSNIALLLQRNY